MYIKTFCDSTTFMSIKKNNKKKKGKEKLFFITSTKVMPVFFEATVQQLLITLHCSEPSYKISLSSNFTMWG